ncbi:MAG: flavodoxin-dependent (E)-4-hydroxy-3-methylbut-2-enyl-diphosphate synthase [Nitrospirota bacterium]
MRLKTPIVKIRGVKLGGNNPIVIQSMTNTDTADAEETAKQCIELYEAGSELVRITVDNEASATAVPKIRKILDAKGYKDLPLIGDFHFIGHKLLAKHSECAKTLDKYRLNPGNVGFGKSRDKNFEEFIKIAIKYKKPVRIGGNWGSINQKLLVKSTLDSAKLAEKLGLKRNQIILSVKVSDVQELIKVYELLVKKMGRKPYALHLGLTEAGSGLQGVVSSSAALAILLQKGIGDTIRISLTPQNNEPRIREVLACKHLLQSLDLRHFRPKIVSCPGCGRTNNSLFQKIVKEVNQYVDKSPLKKLHLAIMGCIVNGPGESRQADIALHLPGKNEQEMASVYVKGKFSQTLTGKNITKEFIKIIEKNS